MISQLAWLAVVGAALLWALWTPQAGLAAENAEVWTLDAYVQQIDAALAALAENDDAALARARDLLAEVGAVRLRSGDVLPLISVLSDVTDVASARDRLLVIRQQIALSASDESAARLASLGALLARPEFNRLETLWDRLWRWLRGWLDRLLPDGGNAPATTLNDRLFTVVGWVVLVGVSLGLVILLSYWLQSFLGGMVHDSERRKRRQNGDETPLTASEARQKATSLAQMGDYRQAVRHLYLSALLTLEEQRLLVVNRSLTNRELLAGVAGEPRLSAHLAPVVNVFDEVWYGVHEPDQETFHSYAQEIDKLNALARQTDRARV